MKKKNKRGRYDLGWLFTPEFLQEMYEQRGTAYIWTDGKYVQVEKEEEEK